MLGAFVLLVFSYEGTLWLTIVSLIGKTHVLNSTLWQEKKIMLLSRTVVTFSDTVVTFRDDD